MKQSILKKKVISETTNLLKEHKSNNSPLIDVSIEAFTHCTKQKATCSYLKGFWSFNFKWEF
jgi:hypothetical protein